jgi:hypothetical protein
MLAVAIVADAFLIVVAYLYSRFVFSEYLRRYHGKRWEELVYGQEYRGLNVLAFDKTPALWRFRCESSDTLGDPRIPRMRRISIYLRDARGDAGGYWSRRRRLCLPPLAETGG